MPAVLMPAAVCLNEATILFEHLYRNTQPLRDVERQRRSKSMCAQRGKRGTEQREHTLHTKRREHARKSENKRQVTTNRPNSYQCIYVCVFLLMYQCVSVSLLVCVYNITQYIDV